MKKTILFKTLIDILYFLHWLVIPLIVLSVFFGKIEIKQSLTETWPVYQWFVIATVMCLFLIFLRGLFFLRRMARSLLSLNYFSPLIIANLKKSGYHFLITGIGSLGLICLGSIVNVIKGLTGDAAFKIGFDLNLVAPLFLVIVGIFFIIQSEALLLGKSMKEENELTV